MVTKWGCWTLASKGPVSKGWNLREEHKPSSALPSQMRGTLRALRGSCFQVLPAAVGRRLRRALLLTGVFSKEQCYLNDTKRSRVGRGWVSETLSSQPSLLIASPSCHQPGQSCSARLITPPSPAHHSGWGVNTAATQ